MNQPQQTLRQVFKQHLTKTLDLPTRNQALKQIQSLLQQNKTTNNLRIFLSVLSENRIKNSECQLQVIRMLITLYGKGLLDPLDKVPSLEKTVFRVTQIIMKHFGQNEEKSKKENIMAAAQSAWLQIYEVTLRDEPAEIKKKLLYNSLQSIINGGGGKIAQITAQFIVDGILERSIAHQDYEFFKEIAKRVLVLFKKTTVFHPASLTCLQTILSFFNIINLLPLLELLVDKILSYVTLTNNNQVTSNSYKIKGQACNCLALIGEQIDRNGLQIYDKIIKALEDMATDKVWAVQAPGRRALAIWRNKKKVWDEEFIEKNQKIFKEQFENNISINTPNTPGKKTQFPKTYNEPWNMKQSKISSIEKIPHQTWQDAQFQKDKDIRDQSASRYLVKNTGMGGGNNIHSVQNYYERQRPDNTHLKKMEELRKNIYQANGDIQFEDTIAIQEEKKQKKQQVKNDFKIQPEIMSEDEDNDFLQMWDQILENADKGKFEESAQQLLKMDDDLYFLRFFLKYSASVLEEMTRSTSNKIIKKMLQIKQTNFMEQMLFKMTTQSIRNNIGRMLPNGQNLQIINYLENAGKISKMNEISSKLSNAYEDSLGM